MVHFVQIPLPAGEITQVIGSNYFGYMALNLKLDYCEVFHGNSGNTITVGNRQNSELNLFL